VEIAKSCEDPDLKKRLLEMADDWLKGAFEITTCRQGDPLVKSVKKTDAILAAPAHHTRAPFENILSVDAFRSGTYT
jgi:hypothetical protein